MKVYYEIKNLPLEEIKPYWNNPRMNERTKMALVEAFEKIGFNQPIVVDRENTIVKGHARFYAATLSGFKTLPCIVSEATDEQNRADRITDNKIQELTEWDYDALKDVMAGIDLTIAELSDEEPEFDTSDEIPGEEPEGAKEALIDLICPKCGAEFKADANHILEAVEE